MNNDRFSDLPQRSGSFQAMVRAGDSVTAYLRTGKGEPVVLLRRPGHPEALWGAMLSEISASFRAILPERAPEGPEFATWFRSFLDGLGLGSVRVVADAHFGVRCADAGLLDPDWLTVLVVATDATGRDAVAHAMAQATDESPESPVTTMLIDIADEEPHAVALRVVQFLKSLGRTTG